MTDHSYDPATIEPKWQQVWRERKTFRTPSLPAELAARPKFYVLDMFPYPSGAGLHVGHPEGYTATDIVARYKRMRGFNVLHPMGWDAFGLPAEQHAIETGQHPPRSPRANIATFRRQIKRLGFSYDWDREVDTTDPDYFRWTQWIFLKLYERGLAYVAEVPVNWCPALGTVLANEEVKDGSYGESGGFPVERRPMRQWMLRITAYAERLLDDLDGLDWPESAQGDAAELDRPHRRRRGRLPPSTAATSSFTRLHHPARHAVRRDLHGARARAPAGRRPSPPPAQRDAGATPTSRRPARKSDLERTDAGQGEDRRLHRRATPSIRSTASASRSGSPTTCSSATAPAPSWPCPATTSATSSSPRSSTCRSSAGRRAAGRTSTARPTSATAPAINSSASSTASATAEAKRADHRLARGRGSSARRTVQLQAARLAVLPPALLGRAVPDRPRRTTATVVPLPDD